MGVIKVGVIVENHPYDIMAFQEMLSSLEGCVCYVQPIALFVQDVENQDKYDVLLFYNMNLPLPEAGSAAYTYLTEHLGEKSQGIILLHHALLSFPKWDLWTQVSGVKVRCEDGVFQYHQRETVRAYITDQTHPITKDMSDFSLIDETYIIGEPESEGNTVLMTTDNARSIKNLAWTRTYKNSRVFCWASGHDGLSYGDDRFRRIVRNGILWSIGRI